MGDMPRPRPRFLNREITRHGKTVWYVRKDTGPRIRIPGVYGSPEFMAAYELALGGPSGALASAQGPVRKETFAWLLAKYRASSDWGALAIGTRAKFEPIFRAVAESAGHEPLDHFTKQTFIDGRERRKDTPHQARKFLDAMRALFRWAAADGGILTADPTEGVKNLKRPRTKGFIAWSDADVAKFEARWPMGTRERVWLDVLLYTGARRGDAVRLGPPMVTDELISFETEKSGEMIEVVIPLLPDLAQSLAAGPTGPSTFIVGERGEPLTKESFGNMFGEAARAAGLVDRTAHGLRKAGATRAAERGATEKELEAIFGWTGGKMAALYTQSANRRSLAKSAAHKLSRGANENKTATSFPAPPKKVRG